MHKKLLEYENLPKFTSISRDMLKCNGRRRGIISLWDYTRKWERCRQYTIRSWKGYRNHQYRIIKMEKNIVFILDEN